MDYLNEVKKSIENKAITYKGNVIEYT